MARIDADELERLIEYDPYYPEFAGWNDGLPDDEKWVVEFRRTPSRKEYRKLIASVQAAQQLAREDGEELPRMDAELLILDTYTRVHNLFVGDWVPTRVSEIVARTDSNDLATELQRELNRRLELSGDEEGNSDAPSGGEAISSSGADPEESHPAEDASATPAPTYAPASTTQSPAEPSPSGGEDSESGESHEEARA